MHTRDAAVPRSIRTFGRCARLFALIGVIASGLTLAAQAPLLDLTERARAKVMLAEIKSATKDKYYDPAFHGLDINAHFKAAETKLDTATSLGHAYAIIAQALIDFGDSHTFFIPPQRAATYEYGWDMQMVGDECLIVAVKPGADADVKGLKPGDRVLRFEAFTPSRTDLWKARYLYQLLSPRSAITLVVQSPGAQPRSLQVAAKVTKGQRVVEVNLDNILDGSGFGPGAGERILRSRVARAGDVAVWRLSGFDFAPEDVDRVFDDIVKGATSLIVDLRGNGGGLVKTLEQLTSRFFDREVKVGDVKGRRSAKASVAKKRKQPFAGKVVVLVDAESGSAAEIFARVMQIEKRAPVVGDRSSGAVMQSVRWMGMLEGTDGLIPYAVSVTEADFLMSDGKSLERVGVVPDEVLLPTQADLAAGRDPVLVRAAALLGATIDPAAAGKLFPVEWK